MTAGIGAGNVVWAAPSIWTPSIIDAQTVALHSPQPRRLNTFNVKSTTQAIEYGLDGGIGMATVALDHVNVSQDECGVYSQSRQVFATTMSKAQPLQGKRYDMIMTEVHNDTNIIRQYQNEWLEFSAMMPCVPLYEEQKGEAVGLGITLPNDATLLKELSTLYDDNDDA